MATAPRVGVFLCRGGKTQADAPDFKRLRWTAEAGVGGGNVYEIAQACQAEGSRQVARLVEEEGLTGFVVGACPLAGPSGDRSRPGDGIWLDLCCKPEGEPRGCQVHPGAAAALGQALAARVFRPEIQLETRGVATDVLVIGDGYAALTAAAEAVQAGYGVILVTPTKRLAPPEPLFGSIAAEQGAALAKDLEADDRVTLIRQGLVLGLTGSAGDFTARVLDREGREWELRVGAAIVTQGPPSRPNLDDLGLDLSDRVITLSDLSGLIGSPEYLRRLFGEGEAPRVAICLGLGREYFPVQLRAACRAALALRQNFGAQVHLLTGNAKVAAPDLEALTQEVRRAGGLLFKFSATAPLAEAEDDGVGLRFRDEILERDVVFRADLVAVDETAAPDETFERLGAALGLAVGRDGRLQPDKIGALPTLTPRGGVFVVGRARLEADLAGVKDDVGQVVQKIRGLLARGEVVVEQSRVRVDRRLCALCLTCVRVCPEGAMGFTERRPASNPLVCTSCGTCAAECPMDAIQVLGDEDDRFETEIEAAGAPAAGVTFEAPEDEARVLVFLCRNSAAKAVEAARLEGLAWPEGASFVEVPCAGKVDPIYVLDAFRAGFDGVLILSCYPDACYSLEGSTWAGHRLVHLQNLLAEAGHDPRRLAAHGVAPVMSSEALAWVEQMKRDVAALGPNPLKATARTREFLRRFTMAMDDSFTLQAQALAGVFRTIQGA